MNRLTHLLAALAVGLVGACGLGSESDLPFDCSKCDHLDDGPSDDLGRRWRGQDTFVSTAPFWDFLPFRTLNEAAATDGARDVEEADVFHHDAASSVLYVLNSYRGLQVVDIANADVPQLIGRAALGGYPIEMFVRDDHAFVLLNSMADAAGHRGDDDFRGAVLRVFDVSDRRNPVETAEFQIPGSVSGSRLLSDSTSAVIYVASNVYSWHAGTGSTQKSFVMSIDVTDPAQPAAIETVDFAGAGWQFHVTPAAMFIANHSWADDLTRIRYVDISDRGGDIAVKGQVSIAGRLAWGDRGELQMNHHDGVLRVASQVRGTVGNPGHIAISTVDTSNPAQLYQLGQLEVGEGHRLLATRFAGNRAYLFHMVQVDPLEVIDLSNPAAPKSMGILKIDGWVNHIEVRGDKLITIGVDDAQSRKLALILFDVSNPAAPVELSRATAGQQWAWTSANHDLKRFKLIDELGVAMLPVSSSHWDDDGRYQFRSWLQLFSYDLGAGTVATRGEVDSANVKRAFPAGNRIVTVSDMSVQSVDIADLDAPRLAASLELAHDVVDFTTVGAFGLSIVGKGDWNDRSTELRVVSLHDPDNSPALATLALQTPPGQMFKLSATDLVSVASDPVGGDTIITSFDFSDPLDPAIAGQLRSAELGFNRWGGFSRFAASPGADIAQVGDALALFTFGNGADEGGKIRVINLANRRFPHESASVELGAATVVGMKAVGTRLFVSSYVPVEDADQGDLPDDLVGSNDPARTDASAAVFLPGRPIFPGVRRSRRVAYQLHIIELANPDSPVVSEPISVPGKFAGLDQIGEGDFATTILYTSDSIPQGESGAANGFDTMMLVGTRKVRLLDIYGLAPGSDDVVVDGDRALFTTSGWWSGPFLLESTTGGSDLRPTATLTALDLSRPDTIRQAARIELANTSFATLAGVANGRAYLSSGWGNLSVLDVSVLESARVIDRLPVLGWWSGRLHTISDGRAFAPAGLFGLHVID